VFVCVDETYAKRRRERIRRLEGRRGIVIIRLKGRGGVLGLDDVLRATYRYGIGSVLVEGGSSVFGQVRDAGVSDEVSIFVAPVMLGHGVRGFPENRRSRGLSQWMSTPVARCVGRDVLLHTVRREGG
jgi:riboflavin biosynthesis pyrimidine reductase